MPIVHSTWTAIALLLLLLCNTVVSLDTTSSITEDETVQNVTAFGSQQENEQVRKNQRILPLHRIFLYTLEFDIGLQKY